MLAFLSKYPFQDKVLTENLHLSYVIKHVLHFKPITHKTRRTTPHGKIQCNLFDPNYQISLKCKHWKNFSSIHDFISYLI